MQEPATWGRFEHVRIDLCGPSATYCADLHCRLYLPKPAQKPIKAHVVVTIYCFT
jgi:hypothetical protein